MSNSIVPSVYRQIIETVCANAMQDFIDLGYDEALLHSIQTSWEAKVYSPENPNISAIDAFGLLDGNDRFFAAMQSTSGFSGSAPLNAAAQLAQVVNSEVNGNKNRTLSDDRSFDLDDFPQLDGADDEERPPEKRVKLDKEGDDEEEEIGSDLDESEEEINTEHIILCQYEKVQRTKNKWKCAFKDGIMRLNGKDYLFHRANGEFECLGPSAIILKAKEDAPTKLNFERKVVDGADRKNRLEEDVDRAVAEAAKEIPEKKKSKSKTSPEVASRTLFISNVNVNALADPTEFRKFLKQFGTLESIRFRSIAINSTSKYKRAGAIKGDLHPSRKSMNAYVIYKKAEEALKALEANGTVVMDKHLRITKSDEIVKENKNTIFVGNLTYAVEDEVLWRMFEEKCGKVKGVRVVRDKQTGMGKGFAYVTFHDRVSVELALKLNEKATVDGKAIRVTKCFKKEKDKEKMYGAVKRKAKAEKKK